MRGNGRLDGNLGHMVCLVFGVVVCWGEDMGYGE